MCDGEGEAKAIDELGLQFGFPRARTIPITAAGITEQEHPVSMGIPLAAVGLPPARHRARRERRRIMRHADSDAPVLARTS